MPITLVTHYIIFTSTLEIINSCQIIRCKQNTTYETRLHPPVDFFTQIFSLRTPLISFVIVISRGASMIGK